MIAENFTPGFIITLWRFLQGRFAAVFRYVTSRFVVKQNKNTISETNLERPPFSTNIFDEREEHEAKRKENWFWASLSLLLFCLGVAASYYIIHNF